MKKLLLSIVFYMKNITKITTVLGVIVTASMLSAVVVACQKLNTRVSLNKTELSLNVGDTYTLIATDKSKNEWIARDWSTSNSDVVSINVFCDFDGEKCIITAKKEGTAIITVTAEDGNNTAKCTIIVTLQPIEPEMVLVEGGTFMMGSDNNILEQPIHQVTISSFNIAKYQVTQREWNSIMGDNLSNIQGDDLPVYEITWSDVNEYITRLNNATGKNYRLPTEAEWEYAARGGKKSTSQVYSGSNDINLVAWYTANCNKIQPVGRKTANELGVFDMSGNVWEYCSDWYGSYQQTPQINPQGPESGTYRILRGGGYNSYSDWCRVTMRLRVEPNNITSIPIDCGLRLVLP